MALAFFKPWRNECSRMKSCISLCNTPNSINEGQSQEPRVHRTKISLCRDFSPRHLPLSYYPLLSNRWKVWPTSFLNTFRTTKKGSRERKIYFQNMEDVSCLVISLSHQVFFWLQRNTNDLQSQYTGTHKALNRTINKLTSRKKNMKITGFMAYYRLLDCFTHKSS